MADWAMPDGGCFGAHGRGTCKHNAPATVWLLMGDTRYALCEACVSPFVPPRNTYRTEPFTREADEEGAMW